MPATKTRETETEVNYTPPEFGEIQTVTAETFVETFQMCPPSLYIRQQITDTALDKLEQNLLTPNGKYQIIDPIKYFILTEKQIEDWGISDAKAGVNYTLNGNTRLKFVESVEDLNNVMPVPIQELLLENQIDESILYRLQETYNDTTVPHSTLEKLKAIAALYARKKEQGLEVGAINELIAKTFGLSKTYAGMASKFIDRDDFTPEEIEDREKLFSLMNQNLLSVDSTVTIMQMGKKHNLTYVQILKMLGDKYGTAVKPGQNLFSKIEILAVKKILDDKAKKANEIITDEQSQSLDEDESEESFELTNDEEDDTRSVSIEAYDQAQDDLDVVLNDFRARIESNSSVEPTEIDNIRQASAKITSATKTLLSILPAEKAVQINKSLIEIVVNATNNFDLSQQEKATVVKVAKQLKSAYDLLSVNRINLDTDLTVQGQNEIGF